ncbi:Flagellar motor switch protein FliM [Roseimaritima multifibrata]|uniref:Flagellar motor switch protein FliM n=1 Tax=Roseimaritima multifibrata TaxID=1930274 RepID=A0A517MCN3_9BACT|nr:flagellar motor switch protein FliM [Roseimaritima multifibrata]QDS92641.1 Flagellar motor switch protein FliM [Roseimaritima multifibrata]
MSEEEPLSNSQVESLLKQMETDAGEPPRPGAGDPEAAAQVDSPEEASAGVGVAMPGMPQVRTVNYDFKRPERVGKEQMRAMHSLHEGLARSFGATVSGMLRTMLEVKLISVDQLTYSEFVFSLDNPSCFNVLKPEPLEGHWILDISPVLSYAIIDRMLGGDPHPVESLRRPLTEIETRLIGRLVTAFSVELTEVWRNIVQLDLTVERVESNPQLVQIVPPNEVIILIGLEVSLGRNRGMMNLCIPFNTIERFNSQLSNNGWVGYSKSRPSDESRQQVSQFIDDAVVDIVVTLAKSRIKTGELLDLSVGDVITTEKDAQSPLELSVQSVPKFTVKPGAHRGKKAVRIDSIIED